MTAKIGVLAVQGAFIEHIQALTSLGVECVELRQAADLEQPLAGLVLPGGESTVQGKLLRDLDMYNALRAKIVAGLPVLATCAGMILLAEKLSNDDKVHFATMPITVRRNAYGRPEGGAESGIGNSHYYVCVGAGTFLGKPAAGFLAEGVYVAAVYVGVRTCDVDVLHSAYLVFLEAGVEVGAYPVVVETDDFTGFDVPYEGRSRKVEGAGLAGNHPTVLEASQR